MLSDFRVRCRRWFWRNRWKMLSVWILIFTIVISLGVRSNRSLAHDGEQAKDALCVLKHDYQRRVKLSKEFLRENPNGIPGIEKGVITVSIKNQESTLKSLHRLKCKDG